MCTERGRLAKACALALAALLLSAAGCDSSRETQSAANGTDADRSCPLPINDPGIKSTEPWIRAGGPGCYGAYGRLQRCGDGYRDGPGDIATGDNWLGDCYERGIADSPVSSLPADYCFVRAVITHVEKRFGVWYETTFDLLNRYPEAGTLDVQFDTNNEVVRLHNQVGVAKELDVPASSATVSTRVELTLGDGAPTRVTSLRFVGRGGRGHTFDCDPYTTGSATVTTADPITPNIPAPPRQSLCSPGIPECGS